MSKETKLITHGSEDSSAGERILFQMRSACSLRANARRTERWCARVNGNGATQEFEYTTNLDGKSHPITGDAPEGADSIAVNLTAPKTMQVTLRKAGKVVGTATISVSGDGKNLTITSKGTRADGTQVNDMAVYDTDSNRGSFQSEPDVRDAVTKAKSSFVTS